MFIRIKIVRLGYIPYDIDWQKLESYESNLFNIIDKIVDINLPEKSTTSKWAYSNESLINVIENHNSFGDKPNLIIAFCNVPLEKENNYGMILNDTVCVHSFLPIFNILERDHIPYFNFIISMIYRRVFQKNVFPNSFSAFTGRLLLNDENRGCIFDMHGHLEMIIYSLQNPKITNPSAERLRKEGISQNDINLANRELSRIKLSKYIRITKYIEKHPIAVILISLLLGVIVNLLSTSIYDGSLITKIYNFIQYSNNKLDFIGTINMILLFINLTTLFITCKIYNKITRFISKFK